MSGKVRLLVPVLVPDPGYFNKHVPGTRVFSHGRADFTKMLGTGGGVVPSLLKCRVRVWMTYQTYQRVGYGYGCCTKLTKGSGMGIRVVPSLPKG